MYAASTIAGGLPALGTTWLLSSLFFLVSYWETNAVLASSTSCRVFQCGSATSVPGLLILVIGIVTYLL